MPPKNTNGFDVRNDVFSSYKTNEGELFRIPYKRNVSTSNNEYAVIISGGANPAYNYARYWNDCSAIYQALVNRYRTYCQMTVNVTDGELRLLAPNPADNQVRIGYALSRKAAAATLQILNGSGQVVYSQALSGGNGSKVTGETLVNTSSLSAGSYTVRLVSNRGNIFDSKTLVIR